MSGPTAPKTKRGAARREALLRAAEAVIGEQGFAASSIADITRRAETALGTFYIYFSSKEEVFRELVLEMGRLTRAGVTEAVQGASNRLEAEKAGLRAFLQFAADRPALYRIVEEARFIDPEVYRAYYDSFGRAYVVQLQRAQAKGEIGPGDPEVRAWALMGMAIKLGERFVLWEDKPDIDHVVEDAFALMRDGLSP
ncbi:TetR/AcrR family transcriptional regulator [Psychromarinibacter halotolerans]|uniref:TetR/AcrR family transcriptional regulator n=1 Tax=Psychromarinibacter halotolerans TaxID=1775175 RepID=A0ABV7H1M7_9RHOB|nr:TetR/AcrR family transcriptional regulator [Psychromarinibacter halotolerans]MAQ81715.1 TetR family transcriptional regulator [Maritimibacter sp.]MDF0598419.1 TetR/AcrR family transcriptional regulator [Psychromarinibacter halotolerans]